MAIKLKKDLLVRNLIKGHKLANHIDRILGEDGEFEWSATFEPKEGDDGWHPSGDCLPSPLALYEKATTDKIDKPSVSLLKSFTVGHFWHAYLQHIVVEKLGFADWEHIERKGTKSWEMEMKPAATVVGATTQFFNKPYHYATGSADIAPCNIPTHGEFLVDIKTMGAHDFKQNGLPAWCAGKYEAQVNIYMDWFDLERCIILCVLKDSPHDFKEFEFQRNQPLIDAVYDKWKLVGACIDQGVAPPEDYDVPLPFVGPKM